MTMEISDKVVTAGLVIIGNEILSGRTKDANLQYLATELNKIGIRLVEVRVVADTPPAIVEAVNVLRARLDYVFTTGGIGPTHDDITSECVAQAFGLPFGVNPQADAILRPHFPAGEFTEARRRMTKTPVGAALIENRISKAPGFRVENVFVLAGVPRIMQAMFEEIRNELKGGLPLLSRTVSSHVPEGKAGGPLTELQARHPDTEIGSYPFFKDGKVGASIVVRAVDASKADAAAHDVFQMLTALGGTPIMEEEADNA